MKKITATLIGLFCILGLTGAMTQALAQEKADASQAGPILTGEEREYIEEAGTIGVSVSVHKGPIQYMDEKTGELKGISVDLFKRISQITGLQFEYIAADGLEQTKQMLREGKTQILSGIPQDEGLKELYGCELSDTYMISPIAAVMKRTAIRQSQENQTLALTVGLEAGPDFEQVKRTQTYPTVIDCIQAVADGKADVTYGNAYVMEFYTQTPGLQGLAVVPLSGRQQELCVGVYKATDERLLSILNKSFAYLTDNGLQQIIMDNAAHSVRRVTLSALIAENPASAAALFAGCVGLILLAAFLVLRSYRRKNRQIIIANRRYAMMAAISNEYFYNYDLREDRMMLSDSTARLFGCQTVWEKWHGVSRQFAPARMIEDTDLEEAACRDIQDQKEKNAVTRIFQVQIPVRDGQTRWFRITRVMIYEAGQPVYVIGKMADIQEEHEERQNLIEKSRRDGLTKLYNAAVSREMIAFYLEQDRSCYGSLMILDIDHFKGVNDHCGHYVGDNVLRAVADILTGQFRTEDIVGRLGGDEFVVFMKKLCEPEDIANKCREIQSRVAAISVGNTEPLTVSIGVAVAAKKVEFAKLYQKADSALYKIKEDGRNGYEIVS